MAIQVRQWAARPFGYGGESLDRGQIFSLRGLPNDSKLVAYRYCFPVENPKQETFRCGECGSEFIDTNTRLSHGNDRHRKRNLSPEEEDEREARREAMYNEIAPVGPPA